MRSTNLLASGLAIAAPALAALDLLENLPDTGLDTSGWTVGQAPSISGLVDANDFQMAAKNTLSPQNYAYYRTAALDEIGYNANILDWAKIKLNGYSFTDVSNSNLKTSILGYTFNAPFFIAPAAQAGLASGGAESNLAAAAGQAGILYVPSISSTQSLETIAAAGSPGQVMFHQEYIWSDTNRLQDELTRMENSGYKAIFLTVDNTGVNGVRNRYQRYSPGGDAGHSADFTIEALNRLRNMTSLPIVPKGVKTAHDVKLCADLGFPAVYISNHGGRVVDLTPTAVEILLDVHRLYPEIFGQIEIYADGGVRRASHILTLLSLGVTAVGLGRSPMYANVYGQQGVSKLISILTQELKTTMALMGQADVNGFRGNVSYINTKKVELDYFGAPLNIDLNSKPKTQPAASNTPSTTRRVSSSSSTATSSLTTGLSNSTATFTTSTMSGAGATATSTSPSCPASNGQTYTAASGRSFQIECGIDHAGGDMGSKTVSSLKQCIDACDSTSGCVDVSLSGVACYLKSTLGAARNSNGLLGAKLVF